MTKIKIGFQKEYQLNSGYTANFWAIGQRNFLFDENEETNFLTPKQIKIDMLLYKDLQSFIDAVSTGVKQSVTIDYTLDELFGGYNLIDLCVQRIQENTVNTYFSDALVIEVPYE